jgi:hypothetical protein
MATSVAEGTARTGAPGRAGPPAVGDVRGAIRLGWFVAEVRGRHWWRGERPPVVSMPEHPPWPLPLRPERTAAESRATARRVTAALAEQFGVAGAPGGEGPSFPERLERLAGSLEEDGGVLLQRPPGGLTAADAALRDVAWAEMAQLVHDWDCAIQDALTATGDELANGYLLGRGLAECYWALAAEGDPPEVRPERPAPGAGGAPAAVRQVVEDAVVSAAGVPEGSASSWEYLFGEARRAELSRLVGRLAPHLPALTPTAVAGSLQVWGDVARVPAWRQDAVPLLYEQYRHWYELVVLGREPTTYVRPYALLHGWRSTVRAFRGLWPQLLLALLSAVAVTAVAYFLGTGRGQAWLTALLGLLGVTGLTASGVAAKAKSAGQQLITRVRQDAYGDLVAVAVSVVPPAPGGGPRAGQHRRTAHRVRAAVRQRHVTPVTPQPDLC